MPKVLKLGDKNYPKLLSKIKNPPKKLYYQGELDKNIFKNCLAVVGTRQMTAYGEEMTDKFIGPIARAGITIVSGFMYGIDAQAHKACLENNGRTIAVLGCGIDLIRPAMHKDLHRKILKNNGLILSEYEGEHPSFRWTFVRRNRIISGLSKVVLVIEAGAKSGSLITANLGSEQKRKIMAVPGPVTSSVSRGTAHLIKEGAILVESPEEILKEFGHSSQALSKKPLLNLSRKEKQIIQLLAKQRLSVDEISRDLNMPAAEIGSSLSLMVLKGFLKEDKRGKYIYVN